MFTRIARHGVVASAVSLAAAFTFAGSAIAAPAQNLSFAASNDGASASWTHGPGSPIQLTMGTTAGSYAMVTLHHVSSGAVSSLTAPSFVTDNYAAGSPRYYLTLSDGHSLWGYPVNLSGETLSWAIDNANSYSTWSQVQLAEGAATVTGAYVIADADQAPGTVDTIDDLTFGGTTYTG